MLKRIPSSFKTAALIHFHGGRNNEELRSALKVWAAKAGALTPFNPPRTGTPPHADIAILTPRCEVAPVILAIYLLSSVPFALLIPVDLIDVARQPGIFVDAPHEEIAKRLEGASQLLMLHTQMT